MGHPVGAYTPAIDRGSDIDSAVNTLEELGGHSLEKCSAVHC